MMFIWHIWKFEFEFESIYFGLERKPYFRDSFPCTQLSFEGKLNTAQSFKQYQLMEGFKQEHISNWIYVTFSLLIQHVWYFLPFTWWTPEK